MTNLILQLVLMISFAVIVYLMAIAVPRVEDSKEGAKEHAKRHITIHIDKLDAVLNKWKDKALRRIKILVMKTDNYIGKQLNKKEEKL